MTDGELIAKIETAIWQLNDAVQAAAKAGIETDLEIINIATDLEPVKKSIISIRDFRRVQHLGEPWKRRQSDAIKRLTGVRPQR